MPKTAAPEPIEFEMQYDATCPECTSAGIPDVPLGFSIGHGGIVCKAGEHHFDALPGSEASAGVLPQPEAASASPAVNSDAGAITLTGFSIKTHGGAGRVDPNRAQEIKARMAEVLQEQMREKARKPVQVVKAPGLTEPVTPKRLEASQAPQRPVQVLDSKPAPARELQVTLRLREPHVQAIMAEAEVQRQTPEQYLNDWIDVALTNYWGR